ncbi:MAG: M20/M25/M40 family metallo-hydrolase, partial [Spirochaetota bacterium]
ERSYPALRKYAEFILEPPWRIVIEIRGSREELSPLLLLAHFDVVDVESGTASDWTHPPFEATEDKGALWGRGTLDDKCCVAALLEAAERTLANGTHPERGFVLAFGGDEELSGKNGAATIASRFKSEGRRFHAVVDEGAIVARGMIQDPTAPIALIGIAEKGFVNIQIEAAGSGGHAAMPSRTTALGDVARAVATVEKHPFRARLLPTIQEFFEALGARASFPTRAIFSKSKLLWPLLSKVLAAKPTTDALIRTTQAVTMASGSAAPGVLPQRARAVINSRILPGESTQDVLAHYRRLLADHPVRVSIAPEGDAGEPVLRSSTDHSSYRSLIALIERHFPDAIPAPYLVTASTDSKWYAELADATYRFVPVELSNEELAGIHGTDEHIDTDAYKRMIAFYAEFIARECCNGE